MTAQRLRDAAARIRETAQAANPSLGGWVDDVEAERMILSQPGAHLLTNQESFDEIRAEGRHIALWAPPVALAVADWLDAAALDVEMVEAMNDRAEDRARRAGNTDGHTVVLPHAVVGPAWAVADLILGGAR